MGIKQSNIEAVLGSMGDIYDEPPTREDSYVEVDSLPPAHTRLLSPTMGATGTDGKSGKMDERIYRAIALAVSLASEPEAEAEAEAEPEAEAEAEAEPEAAPEAEPEAEAEADDDDVPALEMSSDEDESDDDESDDDESDDDESDDDERKGSGQSIATCACAMGYEPRRLFPVTAETVARVIGSGRAILALHSDAEEPQVVVVHGCTVGDVADVADVADVSFTATAFSVGGTQSKEYTFPASDLRFMYGFWAVFPDQDSDPDPDSADPDSDPDPDLPDLVQIDPTDGEAGGE